MARFCSLAQRRHGRQQVVLHRKLPSHESVPDYPTKWNPKAREHSYHSATLISTHALIFLSSSNHSTGLGMLSTVRCSSSSNQKSTRG